MVVDGPATFTQEEKPGLGRKGTCVIEHVGMVVSVNVLLLPRVLVGFDLMSNMFYSKQSNII